jgi:hypothetical protein
MYERFGPAEQKYLQVNCCVTIFGYIMVIMICISTLFLEDENYQNINELNMFIPVHTSSYQLNMFIPVGV